MNAPNCRAFNILISNVNVYLTTCGAILPLWQQYRCRIAIPHSRILHNRAIARTFTSSMPWRNVFRRDSHCHHQRPRFLRRNPCEALLATSATVSTHRSQQLSNSKIKNHFRFGNSHNKICSLRCASASNDLALRSAMTGLVCIWMHAISYVRIEKMVYLCNTPEKRMKNTVPGGDDRSRVGLACIFTRFVAFNIEFNENRARNARKSV